jgi:hypothetical protein
MEYNLDQLTTPLSINEIEFRVQSINNGKYAKILAYKDARADMIRLDKAFGVFGWKREHSRDNKNCTVSIWDKEAEHWVAKEDTGTESMAEAQKGLASDSFKRACFNLGIGRELYDYPQVSIKLKDTEVQETGGRPKYKASFGLKMKEWRWFSQFDDNNTLTYLGCKDETGAVRFQHGKYDASKAQQESSVKEVASEEKPAIGKPTTAIVDKLKTKIS